MTLDAWKINSKVKIILARNWLNTQSVMVNTVKDTVCIKGKLNFTGGKVDMESAIAVAAQMKKIESEIEGIKEIKHVSWKLGKWHKSKGKWERSARAKDGGD